VTSRPRPQSPALTVVVPVLDEEECVGRIYEEVKRRPRYVIDRLEGAEWP
jgi:hypothetical protein